MRRDHGLEYSGKASVGLYQSYKLAAFLRGHNSAMMHIIDHHDPCDICREIVATFRPLSTEEYQLLSRDFINNSTIEEIKALLCKNMYYIKEILDVEILQFFIAKSPLCREIVAAIGEIVDARWIFATSDNYRSAKSVHTAISGMADRIQFWLPDGASKSTNAFITNLPTLPGFWFTR